MGKPATGGEDGEEYQAKRSARVPSDQVSADNDVWREHLAVVEAVPPEKKLFQKNEAPVQHPLRIRSYFQSSLSGERVWDEPPSGASRIKYASDLEKEMAAHQMAECTVVAVPGLDALELASTEQESSGKTKKKKKGFLRSLKQELKKATTPSTVLGTGKIAYKKNSTIRTSKNDPQEDHQLQMAIAMSMNTSAAATDTDPLGPKEEADDDDIAMAKALSMSVADSSSSATTLMQETPEEQMIRKALEQSRLEEAKIPPELGAARLPTGSQKALFELEDALLEEDSVEVAYKSPPDDYDDDGGGKLYASFVGKKTTGLDY